MYSYIIGYISLNSLMYKHNFQIAVYILYNLYIIYKSPFNILNFFNLLA